MNLLQKWEYFFSDLPSPVSFINWTLYWMVGAALQRRVWYFSYGEPALFCNLFVVFVAPPATGKSRAARWAGDSILGTFKVSGNKDGTLFIPAVPFSADVSTFEALIRDMRKATRSFEHKLDDEKLKTFTHASLCVLLSEEFTSMFRTNTEDIVALFRQCYDGKKYHYTTKHNEDWEIKNPLINLLGCTNQAELNQLFRRGIVNVGFASRIIFIVEDAPRSYEPFFNITPEKQAVFSEIKEHIKKLLKVNGQLQFTEGAMKYYIKWCKNEWWNHRVNSFKGLDEYYGRKNLHLLKLASAIHFCRIEVTGTPADLIIEEEDMVIAKRELALVELQMHKAVSTAGRNELAETSIEILKFITKKGECSKNEIIVNFWADCRNPKDDIEACLNYLIVSTGQVRYDDNLKKFYLIKKG